MISFAAVVDGPPMPPPVPQLPPSVRGLPEVGPGRGRTQTVLRVRAAGFPRRLGAAIVDLMLVTVVATLAALAAGLALGVHLPTAKELGADFVLAGLLDRNPMVAGALGLLVGMSALYQVYMVGILGQTLGKRLFGLRVISSQGRTPGPLVACVRFLTMAVSLALAGLGFLWCIFDRERRALHDHISGTYVILDER